MKDLRIEARMTVFELASKAGVSISSITRMERGGHKMRRLVVVKVLHALNATLGRNLSIEDIEGLQLAD